MKRPGSQSSSWHLWRPGGCCWSERGFETLAHSHMANLCARTGDPLLKALCAADDGCWLVAVPFGRDHWAVSTCFPWVSSKGWVQTPTSGHFKSNWTPCSTAVHLGLPVGSGQGAEWQSWAGAQGWQRAEAGVRTGSTVRAWPGYAVLSAPRSAMSTGPLADPAQQDSVSLFSCASGDKLLIPPSRSCAGVRLSTKQFPRDEPGSETHNFYQC